MAGPIYIYIYMLYIYIYHIYIYGRVYFVDLHDLGPSRARPQEHPGPSWPSVAPSGIFKHTVQSGLGGGSWSARALLPNHVELKPFSLLREVRPETASPRGGAKLEKVSESFEFS